MKRYFIKNIHILKSLPLGGVGGGLFSRFVGGGLLLVSAGLLTGCKGYLDEMPDNRTEIDTEDKVEYLLTSAYADHDFQLVTEFMSDNVDDAGESNPYTDRFLDQVALWQDVTEHNNECPEEIWQGHYNAIAAANQALASIDEIEAASGVTDELEQARGEALLCRAYNHFLLVNIFAKQYSAANASAKGITYMETPETTLKPDYQRNTVGEVYAKIDADIQEALPIMGSSYMTVPKYHFNESAAYAFAAHFYLFYEKYDKAIEYATKVLGSSPKSMLKSYSSLASKSTYAAQSQAYIDAADNGNLLLTTGYSSMGLAFGPYYVDKRYSHNAYIAAYEDIVAPQPWASNGRSCAQSDYYTLPRRYSATNLNCYIFWRVPYLFEYTDPVAGIGYRRAVFPEITSDECLLDRAEAYAMLKQYDKAAEDLNIWISNTYKKYQSVTPTSIQEFYGKIAYAYDNESGMKNVSLESTPKKHLNPGFDIDEEGSVQESMLQAIINARRIETLGCGKRWFDIKRWGIEIPRRVMASNGMPENFEDWLLVDDERRAVQIPQKVTDAGYESNPRDTNKDSDAGEMVPEMAVVE